MYKLNMFISNALIFIDLTNKTTLEKTKKMN